MFAGIGSGIVALKRLGIQMQTIVHVEHDPVATHGMCARMAFVFSLACSKVFFLWCLLKYTNGIMIVLTMRTYPMIA